MEDLRRSVHSYLIGGLIDSMAQYKCLIGDDGDRDRDVPVSVLTHK